MHASASSPCGRHALLRRALDEGHLCGDAGGRRRAGRGRHRHPSCARRPEVYDCKAGADGKLAWTFREPIATLLLDGKTVGRHYAGPSWEHLDGSAVVGKVAGRAPGSTARDIPWLKLDVTERRGSGLLAAATTIQRIATSGGLAEGACDKAGSLLSVPYAADYVFLKK